MAPGGMAGAQQQSLAKVKLAMEALQDSLAGLPMGSDLHAEVLKTLTGLTKKMQSEAPPQGQDQNAIIQQLVAMQRQGGASPQAGAMQAMFPGGGAPPGGAPPAG